MQKSRTDHLPLLIAGLALTAALPLGAQADDATVAEVDGYKITRSELEDSVQQQLDELDRQRARLLEDALEPLVDRRLLEAEAERRGSSLEQLLESEVQSKATEVTSDAVQRWFHQNRSQVRGSLEQLEPQIRSYLKQQRMQAAYSAFLSDLRSKHQVRLLLEPLRVTIPEDGATARGSVDAPVTIAEFSDFQCPACKAFNPVLEQILASYGDKVRVAFFQSPLRAIHPHAQRAAEAALCARDQGKFWQLHDVLFANQDQLQPDNLESHARGIGLDGEAFDACLESDAHEAQIQHDLDLGSQIGNSGTPSVYVNGRMVSPGHVPSYDQLAALIDDELSRHRAASAEGEEAE